MILASVTEELSSPVGVFSGSPGAIVMRGDESARRTALARHLLLFLHGYTPEAPLVLLVFLPFALLLLLLWDDLTACPWRPCATWLGFAACVVELFPPVTVLALRDMVKTATKETSTTTVPRTLCNLVNTNSLFSNLAACGCFHLGQMALFVTHIPGVDLVY